MLAFIFLNFAITLREKIGQMVIIGIPNDKDTTKEENDEIQKALDKQISNGDIGGVILFGRNITEDLKDRIDNMQSKTKAHPLFIAVDQEGGKVARIKDKIFPSAKEMAKKSLDEINRLYDEMALMIREKGINTVFGPVVDLDLGCEVISGFERSYDKDPNVVIKCANSFINGMHKYGILTCLKHFPGHGSAKGDTHKGFVDTTKDWLSIETYPYQMINPIDMVMVAHTINDTIDEFKNPASISGQAINVKLRKNLGYDGVVISDDFLMGAMQQYELKDIVIKFINAGGDILLFGNNKLAYKDQKNAKNLANPNLGKIVVDIIEKAIKDGIISQKRIEQSYERISRLKNEIFWSNFKNNDYKKENINFTKLSTYKRVPDDLEESADKDNEYCYSYQTKPFMLVFHATILNSDDTKSIFEGSILSPPVSIHYVIDENGNVIKSVPEYLKAYQAGISYWDGYDDINPYSIGIEFINPIAKGIVERYKDTEFYNSYKGIKLKLSDSFRKIFGPNVDGKEIEWTPFTKKQIESGKILASMIKYRYNIQDKYIVGHSDIAFFREYEKRRFDPGPLFPWEEFADAGIGLKLYRKKIEKNMFGKIINWIKANILFQDYDGIEYKDRLKNIQINLRRLGYKCDNINGDMTEETRKMIMAFQMHYRQSDISGEPDIETYELSNSIP